MHRKQSGLSLISLFFVAMGIVFLSIAVMKVVPAYIEYVSIKKVLSTMVADPELANAKSAQIRESFTRRSQIDNITSISASDLVITRNNGQLVLSAQYQVQKPLFSNIGVYINFAPTTASGGS